ncbi:uncharacterized protein [Lolium perenne]|uniref:uncharacterized protein n=1 Tax=Lolium perenne TaxID=4522 RepID=UPI003A99EB6E
MPGFMECVSKSWSTPSVKLSSVAILADNLKKLRYNLKHWQKCISQLKVLIEKCNQAIFILDSIEDKRPLSVPEFNFRQLVKLHLEDLLLAQCMYWRKRCTIRWIKMGEDNTKFFHAKATERFRHNFISSLVASDGREIRDHDQMAGLLWASYKERMGSSEGISMQFDLSRILNRVEGLDILSRPFEEKEMDDIVKNMPADRAPGPDGYSGLFLKKCWHIIKTIQDCLAWTYEYIYQCQLSKKPILIVKLDFAKAFDTIEHKAILQILKYKGFDDVWIGWMKEVLSSGSSSILLNGVPGKQFICKRGVRQGDPLSPLLYVCGGDLLQSVINDNLNSNVLHLPIITNDSEFPVVQYADDTILLLAAEMDQVLALKEILHKFGLSTGLRVNFQKSQIVPLNVEETVTIQLAEALGCQIGSLPFPYLGLPLGTTKPSIQDLMPIVHGLERRLTATSIFLSQGARLQLISSALCSMPLHFLLSLKLPPGLIFPSFSIGHYLLKLFKSTVRFNKV